MTDENIQFIDSPEYLEFKEHIEYIRDKLEKDNFFTMIMIKPEEIYLSLKNFKVELAVDINLLREVVYLYYKYGLNEAFNPFPSYDSSTKKRAAKKLKNFIFYTLLAFPEGNFCFDEFHPMMCKKKDMINFGSIISHTGVKKLSIETRCELKQLSRELDSFINKKNISSPINSAKIEKRRLYRELQKVFEDHKENISSTPYAPFNIAFELITGLKKSSDYRPSKKKETKIFFKTIYND